MTAWDTQGNNPGPGDFLGTLNAQALVVKIAGTEHVRIDTNGNVGVGTSTPAYPLHLPIGKALRIDGGASATDSANYFSFGGSGAFGIDAPGVSNGRLVIESSGNVGIGITNPTAKLHVAGSLSIEPSAGDATIYLSGASITSVPLAEGTGLAFFTSVSRAVVASALSPAPPPAVGLDVTGTHTTGSGPASGTGPLSITTLTECLRIDQQGNVGIGTQTPMTRLDVRGQGMFQGPLAINNTNCAAVAPGEPAVDTRAAITFGAKDTPSALFVGACTNDTRANTIFGVYSYALGNWVQNWHPDGRVEFPKNVSAGESLSVTGNVSVAGNVNVSGDVLLTGSDCAEQFDVGGSVPPAPGSVIVIDQGGTVAESKQPYDQKVAGVVSGAGRYRPALMMDAHESLGPRVAVALAGKVDCLVDATYAPIEAGDLLTSSATPGHAMKASDPRQSVGAILGKALTPLGSGRGLISMLISLQ
jgi:hypothetical protein